MANKFWVGGGTNTNWNSSPVTNWANTSGGAGNQTAPAIGDDVTFDNSSGTGASVWNTSISLNSLICTNSRNLVTHSAAVTITISGGNLALPGGVGATYTASNATTSLFTLTGTSGTQTITSNGKNLAALTLNGAGGTFQLQDNLNCTSGQTSIITLTSGTFDCQSFTVSASKFFSSGAVARVLKGSGLWTLSATGATNVWDTTTTTNLTVTNFTSAITFSATTVSARTFALGGLSLAAAGTITIAANSSGGGFAVAGGGTISALAMTAPTNLLINNGTTLTISNAPTLVGSPASQLFICSSSPGNTATISIASGSATMSWTGIRDIAFSGGATFTANQSFDLGHNSGITINAPTGITRSRIQAGF